MSTIVISGIRSTVDVEQHYAYVKAHKKHTLWLDDDQLCAIFYDTFGPEVAHEFVNIPWGYGRDYERKLRDLNAFLTNHGIPFTAVECRFNSANDVDGNCVWHLEPRL